MYKERFFAGDREQSSITEVDVGAMTSTRTHNTDNMDIKEGKDNFEHQLFLCLCFWCFYQFIIFNSQLDYGVLKTTSTFHQN